MSLVFISYARVDREVAGALALQLEKASHTVFWDRAIPPGTRWEEMIERAVREADVVVVLWSQASIASSWVRAEASFAADEGKLIPVMIERVSIPLRYRAMQAADLVGWDAETKAGELDSLLEAIERLAAARPPRIRVVEVTLGESRVTVGQCTRATAVAKDARGNRIEAEITWSSVNSTVAAITAGGDVHALAPGATTIVACAGGITAERALVVLASSAGSPARSSPAYRRAKRWTFIVFAITSISVGAASLVRVVESDTPGPAPDPGPASDTPIVRQGSSTAPPIPDTTVADKRDGATTPGAKESGLSSRAKVASRNLAPSMELHVEGLGDVPIVAGDTISLRATARTGPSGGQLVEGVVWLSDTPEIVTIDRNSGVVIALREGMGAVTAISGTVRATQPVNVMRRVPSDIRIAYVGPRPLRVGDTTVVRALVLDQRGRVLIGQPVDWRSSDPKTIAVDVSGRLRALGAGNARISAGTGNTNRSIDLVAVDTVAPPPPQPSIPLSDAEMRALRADLQALFSARDREGRIRALYPLKSVRDSVELKQLLSTVSQYPRANVTMLRSITTGGSSAPAVDLVAVELRWSTQFTVGPLGKLLVEVAREDTILRMRALRFFK